MLSNFVNTHIIESLLSNTFVYHWYIKWETYSDPLVCSRPSAKDPFATCQ